MSQILGGARRDRTADLLHAMQALSQLSYSPTERGLYGCGQALSRISQSGGLCSVNQLLAAALAEINSTALSSRCTARF